MAWFGRQRRTVVPKAAVRADLLETLEVLTQLHVEGVGHHLAELAILDVLLAVKHPVRHLELTRVLDDRHETLDLLLGKLARTAQQRGAHQQRRQPSPKNAQTAQSSSRSRRSGVFRLGGRRVCRQCAGMGWALTAWSAPPQPSCSRCWRSGGRHP